MLPTVRAIRYVAPLREGGSMPGIMEADDDGTYVVKYRGAGQGPKALVAELLAGEIGRALGLPVPEAALAIRLRFVQFGLLRLLAIKPRVASMSPAYTCCVISPTFKSLNRSCTLSRWAVS